MAGDRRRPRHADRRADRLGQDARRVSLGARSTWSSDAVAGLLEDRVRVVYVSPLKALGNDIEKNLQRAARRHPRAGRSRAESTLPEIRVAVRTGDTPARERQLQVRRPPHILITTPESLYILLTAEKSRAGARRRRDRDRRRDPRRRRRQARRAPRALARAPRRPGAAAAAAHRPLGDAEADRGGRAPARRRRAAATATARRVVRSSTPATGATSICRIETTDLELGPIASHELRAAIYERIVELVGAPPHDHRVRQHPPPGRARRPRSSASGSAKARSPRTTAACRARLASRPRRASRSARSPVVVATASLELGIDVGHVDLVCHLGAPRSIATLLQRVGRSGHLLGAVPKGILFPLTRDELVQCAAAVRAVAPGRARPAVDSREPARHPRAADRRQRGRRGGRRRGALRARAPRLSVPQPGARTTSTTCSRCSPKASRPGAAGAPRICTTIACTARLRARRGARLAAITGGGAIPDTADYDVVEDADRRRSSARSTRTSRSRAWPATSSCSAIARGASAASRRATCACTTRRARRRRSRSGSAKRRRARPELSAAVARPAPRGRRAAARSSASDRLAHRRNARCPLTAPQQIVRYVADTRRRPRRRADARHDHRRALLRRGRRHAARRCTRRSAAASTAPSASRCASASASASTSSCRPRRPTTASCSRSASSTASRSRASSGWCARRRFERRPRAGGARCRRCSPTAGAGTPPARSRCCASQRRQAGADRAPAHARRGPARGRVPGAARLRRQPARHRSSRPTIRW